MNYAMAEGKEDALLQGVLAYSFRGNSMQDNRKTKAQLIAEVEALRQQAAELVEREQAGKETPERQRFLEQVANPTPQMLYVYDLVQLRNLYINDRITTMLG